MRLLTLSKLLALAAGATWVYKHKHRFASSSTGEVTRDDLAADPNDPIQRIADDQFDVSDLAVDAVDVADAEAAQDLAMLESELDESALELDTPSQTTLDANEIAVEGDTGELYGVHTPRAVDRTLPDDREAMEDGQNWLEALQESAVEFGADPEHDLDPLDDQDTAPHPSDLRDRPVADRGSGGPAGV
jgi:hypothetical protein